MNKSFSLIVTHCLETLPDSIQARRALLNAIRSHLSDKHPLAKEVNQLHAQLVTHQDSQLWLANEFRNAAAQTPKA